MALRLSDELAMLLKYSTTSSESPMVTDFFSLLEKPDDLFIGKSCGLHIRSSPKFADQLPLPWYG